MDGWMEGSHTHLFGSGEVSSARRLALELSPSHRPREFLLIQEKERAFLLLLLLLLLPLSLGSKNPRTSKICKFGLWGKLTGSTD